MMPGLLGKSTTQLPLQLGCDTASGVATYRDPREFVLAVEPPVPELPVALPLPVVLPVLLPVELPLPPVALPVPVPEPPVTLPLPPVALPPVELPLLLPPVALPLPPMVPLVPVPPDIEPLVPEVLPPVVPWVLEPLPPVAPPVPVPLAVPVFFVVSPPHPPTTVSRATLAKMRIAFIGETPGVVGPRGRNLPSLVRPGSPYCKRRAEAPAPG
jgi:hypothetical protein